jgi:hypothetical protein
LSAAALARAQLAAANARIAELEWSQQRIAGDRDAANARAEAAEQRTRTELGRVDSYESECVALRAEVERLWADLVVMAKAYDNASNQRDAVLYGPNATESRLAAANALLVRARDTQADDDPFAIEIDAHLAAQPATAPVETVVITAQDVTDAVGVQFDGTLPPRTEAEQRVLEAGWPGR